MSRTASAVVTLGDECLGEVGPFPVDVPWWAEVAPVVDAVEETLGVPVVVLRLLSVEQGEGARDGHVTYHVEASERPGSLRATAFTLDTQPLRLPWATADGVRELLAWAADAVPLTGRPRQHKSWNLAALFYLPTADGGAWLKATPPFAADEAAAIGLLREVDAGIVPRVLASAPGRLLLADVPGEDLWNASETQVTSTITRFVAAQAAVGGSTTAAPGYSGNASAPLRDRTSAVLRAHVEALLDGPVAAELSADEIIRARALNTRWAALEECGLPDTLVHGDFHPGNWRGTPESPPTVIDFADAYWGNPVQDGLRAIDYLPESRRATAAKAWIAAWGAAAPGSNPAEALRLAEPLAHLAFAVRYQEFLDGIEPSERIYHHGDPAAAIRHALASA
ncbi:aminoglycoside phosphotransferase family protein [Cryptosporangium aurantiacum]|uniref:Ser/Thr protein kinase RdoA involved in Cpx stress response, MazF antagonist n=1 Tax=Cryptosporangium aurantiacum TaxID=134849 RepID=A0A1M7R8D1_9ACTN|nr:aminoglycoside phosphotransferase family protein [Cryptosporangium aurantiacum]SHN42493.1 Ser/Thr protein kinase RdoA involved in Cpx stress response, MazF antagonist [Cryptosporangium aurantiacum]